MKLTNNFSLSEFTRSNNAERLNIENTPDAEQTENLQNCVQDCYNL